MLDEGVNARHSRTLATHPNRLLQCRVYAAFIAIGRHSEIALLEEGMVNRKPLKHVLQTALVIAAASLCAATYAADTESSSINDLGKAADALGLQMLRPHINIEPHRPYVMIVRDPSQLIPLGVDDVGPGDRVICRLLDGNRIVLYTSYGDRSAPIQLAPDGSVQNTQTVQAMAGNKHISAQYRDRYEGMYDPGPSRSRKSGMSTAVR